MKIVILCGGQGSRIRDVSEVLPKPMLPIGNKPILWHIMKIYSHFGFNDFVLCLGYKGWVIKEFFLNYYAKTSDITLTLGKKDSVAFHTNTKSEANWKVALVETGDKSDTGTRIQAIKPYLADTDVFGVTYGDGVADINIKELLKTHQKSGRLATVTGVHPLGRFGEIEANGSLVSQFNEKPNVSTGLINGGFMVFNQKALNKYFSPEGNYSLEHAVLPKIAKDRQLGIYQHKGYWQCVDTSREYDLLNASWETGKAPWKVWR